MIIIYIFYIFVLLIKLLPDWAITPTIILLGVSMRLSFDDKESESSESWKLSEVFVSIIPKVPVIRIHISKLEPRR